RRAEPEQFERLGRARPGVVAGRKVRFVFQRQIGRVQAGDRGARRSDSAARDRASTPDALLHAVVVARFEEDSLHRHESESVGVGGRFGPGQDRRNDPWMVPRRTLNPVWSPDSKWVAYSSRLNSLYHAIFISNVESGESKQITDGLAD